LKKTKILPAALFLLGAGMASAASLFPQDTIIVQKITSTRKNLEGERNILLSGNMVKIRDVRQSETTELIIDLGTGRFWTVDPVAKTFRESSMTALQKKNRDAWESFGKLATDEQQKYRMQAQAMPSTKVVPTDEFASVAGFKARKYEVTVVEQKQEIWASPALTMPNQYYDFQELRAQLVGPRGDSFLGGPRGEALRDRIHELRRIDGFALRHVVHYGQPGDTYTVTTETTEVRRPVKIPAAEFEVPKGFSSAPDRAPATAATPAAMNVPMR
jgi:hypothetical protein